MNDLGEHDEVELVPFTAFDYGVAGAGEELGGLEDGDDDSNGVQNPWVDEDDLDLANEDDLDLANEEDLDLGNDDEGWA